MELEEQIKVYIALGQYANFKINRKIDNEKKFLNSVNHFLKKLNLYNKN